MDSQYFYGSYLNLNFDRRRLALPSRIRESLKDENQIILTIIGDDKCVFGYSKKTWEEVIVKQELYERSINSNQGKEIRRGMFSNAVIEEMDAHGRFVVSQSLTQKAGIDKSSKVTVIGAGDHFEIWDTKNWEQYKQNTNI